MPLSRIEGRYFYSEVNRIEQGDILRDATVIESITESGTDLEVTERLLPYCIVISQDCDLEHDYNNRSNTESANSDKYLQSILVCPAYLASVFRQGEHLQDRNMSMQRINSDEWKRIKNNTNPRYHYLSQDAELQVPELVVDFKHYFTVPRSVAYGLSDNYLATIEIVFREHLSSRFAHYLCRIGLPELSD